jgi:hypothetical protein
MLLRAAPRLLAQITVDKPLGLTLADKKGNDGGVVVASVSGGGNAAKAGLKAGDTVLYTSSFFGDELWPADKASFTRTAINAKQNDVDFIILRGKQADEVNVKRLKARPSPPRFGRKLTAAQKARATHICLDWCVPQARARTCCSRWLPCICPATVLRVAVLSSRSFVLTCSLLCVARRAPFAADLSTSRHKTSPSCPVSGGTPGRARCRMPMSIFRNPRFMLSCSV